MNAGHEIAFDAFDTVDVRNGVNPELKAIAEEKQNMMMEISITVGKALRASELEGRKPLWESTPEEFGLDRADLNSSSMRRLDDVQENLNAIRKQT